jgi:prephenate dehydrogenase
VLIRTLPYLAEDTVIVDVATVKVHTSRLLQKLAGNRRYIATHPMFGPESYIKQNQNVLGFKIVITEHTLQKDILQKGIDALKMYGFDVVILSSNVHDRYVAETLFLTHLIGQSVTRGSFSRTDIDTVSFGYLMNAVESVRKDTKLFEDVYRYNPYCKDTMDRFKKAQTETLNLLLSL